MHQGAKSFTLSGDGTLKGDVDTSHSGSEGAEFRGFLKETDDKERREVWEHYIGLTLPGVTLDGFQFAQPSALDKPLEFHYKVTASQYAHTAGRSCWFAPCHRLFHAAVRQ